MLAQKSKYTQDKAIMQTISVESCKWCFLWTIFLEPVYSNSFCYCCSTRALKREELPQHSNSNSSLLSSHWVHWGSFTMS